MVSKVSKSRCQSLRVSWSQDLRVSESKGTVDIVGTLEAIWSNARHSMEQFQKLYWKTGQDCSSTSKKTNNSKVLWRGGRYLRVHDADFNFMLIQNKSRFTFASDLFKWTIMTFNQWQAICKCSRCERAADEDWPGRKCGLWDPGRNNKHPDQP